MANILIVEDDKAQRENLKTMIQEMGQALCVLEAQNAHEAFEISTANTIDLFYLDVHLPDVSGLELARKIREVPYYNFTWIIFITSHIKYMLEAFKEIHCYDYILKPIEKDAMQNITMKLLTNNKPDIEEKTERKHIFIEISGVMVKIFADEIVFVEVYRKTCVLHTIKGKYEVKNLSLKKILSTTPKGSLVQSHKSYAINIGLIQEINKKLSCWEIIFKNYEEKALIGDKYKDNVMNICKQYIIRR